MPGTPSPTGTLSLGVRQRLAAALAALRCGAKSLYAVAPRKACLIGAKQLLCISESLQSRSPPNTPLTPRWCSLRPPWPC